jgi:Pyridoxal-phosphate dependent enzyme
MRHAVGALDRFASSSIGSAVPSVRSIRWSSTRPALLCSSLGHTLGCSVTLKIETLNPVRSFKGRGTETVAAVARKHGASLVICARAGNLGEALAYSGSRRAWRSPSWRREPPTRSSCARSPPWAPPSGSKAATSKTPGCSREKSRSALSVGGA